MELSPTLIIYGAIFLGVLILVQAIYLLVFGRSIQLESRLNRRLEFLEDTADRLTVRDNTPVPAAGKRFIRLRITQP